MENATDAFFYGLLQKHRSLTACRMSGSAPTIRRHLSHVDLGRPLFVLTRQQTQQIEVINRMMDNLRS